MKQFFFIIMICTALLLQAQYQEPERYSNDIIDSFSTNAFEKLVEYDQMKKTVTLKSRQVFYFINNPTAFLTLYAGKDFSLNPPNEGVNAFDTSTWSTAAIQNAEAKVDPEISEDFKRHLLQIVATIPDKGTYLNSIFASETGRQDQLLQETKNVNPLKRARCANAINYYIGEMDNAELEINKLKNLSLEIVNFASQKQTNIAQKNVAAKPNQASKSIAKKETKQMPTATDVTSKPISSKAVNQASSSINEIYFKDYGYVNRTVIVLSKKTSYTIQKERRAFLVNINNATGSNAKYKNRISSNVIDSYDVKDMNGGAKVTVQTDNYPIVKVSELPGRKFKIVLDIFAVESPQNAAQYFSFADFYDTVGFKRTALKYYDKWDRSDPSNKNGYYAYGKLLARRGKNTSARKVLALVQPQNESYNDAQNLLRKLGNSTMQKRSNVTQKKTTKSVQQKQKTASNKPTSKPVKLVEVEENLDLNKEANELYLAYKSYFSTTKDLNLQRYLAGISAKAVQNYDSAQKALLSIEDSSPLIDEMYKEMLAISEATGDEENANLYRSLVMPEEESSTSLMKGGIPIWMAIVLMLASSGIVFFLLMIYYNKKIKDLNEDELFTVNDVAYHEDRIKEAYNNTEEKVEEKQANETAEENAAERSLPEAEKNINETEGLETVDLPIEKEEEEISLQFDKDSLEKEFQSFVDDNPGEFGDFDFDNPDILADELTSGEEQDLIDAEKEMLFGSEDDKDLDDLGMNNDNRQKMVQKLINDGWEIEEIAKELQISQREVEIIAKI